jgi:hypothetical protein
MLFENSDVLLPGSVAVEVIICPGATVTGNVGVKLALPVASVVTAMEPMKVWPSPNPDGLLT